MYVSTRGNGQTQGASQAIADGMVPGGGLYVPTVIPKLDWQELQGLTYAGAARHILELYLPDFPAETLTEATSVYASSEIFTGGDPAQLRAVGGLGVLELWHGPTAAFKDLALQVLPVLLRQSLQMSRASAGVLILVATSGDTGKAALEGFKNVPGTQIVVFYPDGGVSPVQERQMVTTNGRNTHVVAVRGNFDQCQTAVKEMFASEPLRARLEQQQLALSSANSINWGRLLPQIVYYAWAYLQAVAAGKAAPGTPINVVVPTGNFGNILAAYYAKRMGIPLARLICASNKNKVLTDFFATGTYESRRPFYLTMAPSMDILISSNFERFLYEMSGREAANIRQWFDELARAGHFAVDAETLRACQENMWAGWADEDEILRVIGKYYEDCGYVFDPHTAVAVKVYEDYVRTTGDRTYSVVASTASPFKFSASVLRGLGEETAPDDWEALHRLQEKTGWEIPRALRDLQAKPEQEVLHAEPQELEEIITRQFSA